MQQLLNPFAQKFPESNEATLPSSAACVRYNPTGPYAGHYLAAGCLDGLVEVWDVETRGVARELKGHVRPVGSVSWSRNNRYLLSASLDSTCIIWDLSVLRKPSLLPQTPLSRAGSRGAPSQRQRVHTIRFDAPVSAASFHPRSSKIVLAALTCNEVVLVDLRKGKGSKSLLQDRMEGEGQEEAEGAAAGNGAMSCAAFSPCGSRIYAGTTRGKVLTIDPVTRLVANSAIRQLAFDPSGRYLITSATDRALRLLHVSPLGILAPSLRFQDSVNRTPWNAVGFSGDAEYVMGGAGHKAGHNIFVWDRDSGVLVKVLEGPRESLGDCDWHPTRPAIASTTTSGDIQLWHTTTPDNWAAFAPGFEELEENVEYDEREDEFDIVDETELTRRQDAEEDFNVDIRQPDDSYPRCPDPLLALPTSTPAADENGAESEASRVVRAAVEALEWAQTEEGDGDDWDGFYLSLDLLESPAPENDDN